MPTDLISNVRSISHTREIFKKKDQLNPQISQYGNSTFIPNATKNNQIRMAELQTRKKKNLRYYDRTIWISKLLYKFYKWNVVLYMPNADKSVGRQAELEIWKQRTLHQVLDALFS